MKDVEILLRGFAMLMDGASYAPSMVKFLNRVSRKCKRLTEEQISYLAGLIESFIAASADLPENAFLNKRNKRFNVALYEATFAAVCADAYSKKVFVPPNAIEPLKLEELESDKEFLAATIEGTTQTKNVTKRLERARVIFSRKA